MVCSSKTGLVEHNFALSKKKNTGLGWDRGLSGYNSGDKLNRLYISKMRLVFHYFITTNKKPYALILNSILEHELCMCTLIGKKLNKVP